MDFCCNVELFEIGNVLVVLFFMRWWCFIIVILCFIFIIWYGGMIEMCWVVSFVIEGRFFGRWNWLVLGIISFCEVIE